MRTLAGVVAIGALVTAAAAEPLFVPALPPKPGLWEMNYVFMATAPSQDAIAAMPASVTHYMPLLASSDVVSNEPTSAVEQVCWTDAMINKAQWKADLAAALKNTVATAPCSLEKDTLSETSVLCPLGDNYIITHSYERSHVGNDRFIVTESYAMTRQAALSETIISYQTKLQAHWLGPDCKSKNGG